ncbi:MAG: hypothetical protein LQ344_006713 [Seirophora lacunosa]|nr:MAG: hypothetical protein LQ344_006713 [Seirophora lacunosa]
MHFNVDVENQSAPWSTIPRVSIVGIEHPYMISDIGRAINTLGGSPKTSQLVGQASTSIEADLYFHPGDRNSKPVASFNTSTSNLLCRVTVPKRTGRKRKRGSDQPWQESSPSPQFERPLLSDPDDVQCLVASMQDNADRYRTELVGSIDQTHRFRRLPDFVWSTEKSPFLVKMKENILPFAYPNLKNFRFDMSRGVQKKNELIPPPSWTHQRIPFNYSYLQNPSLKQAYTSDGALTLHNTQVAQRNRILVISHDAISVPTEPHCDLPPESTLAPTLQTLLAEMREIFERRPIGTRRSVQNQVSPEIWKAVGPHAAKSLWQYVGYLWNSGPWRDAICAFGVDPRKHKEMRWYQTVVFHFDPGPHDARADPSKLTRSKADRDLAAKGEVATGHLFDGRTVRLDGKVWQMCDVSDPLIKSMLDTTPLRDECDTSSDGWYPNGTWAKLKIIMKVKMTSILDGDVHDPQLDNELSILNRKIPDIMTERNRSEAIFEKGTASSRMVKWAESVRTVVMRPGGRNVAWGPETVKKKKPESAQVSPAKKNTTPGRGRGKGSGGGRPRKGGSGGGRRAGGPDEREEPEDVQAMIDPRLRDVAGDVEYVAREAALKAFEDDDEGSANEGGSDVDGSSDAESSESGGSESGSSGVSESEDEDPDTDESEAATEEGDAEEEDDDVLSASE